MIIILPISYCFSFSIFLTSNHVKHSSKQLPMYGVTAAPNNEPSPLLRENMVCGDKISLRWVPSICIAEKTPQ